ncbi:MAG: fructose-bisphosphatase class III, partial [Phycisphaerales bacterium]
MFERHPEWNLSHRRLLHAIDHAKKTVTIDGVEHPLLDSYLPTIDPKDPYAYSAAEQQCIDRMKESFTRSMKLREHMEWLVGRGGMWTHRNEVLFFHACVPVDKEGTPQTLRVDGRDLSGRELMEGLESVVRRA